MDKKTKRVFVPTSRKLTVVKRWTWSKKQGLMVEYLDGYTMKSAYTLPELLKIERVVEV